MMKRFLTLLLLCLLFAAAASAEALGFGYVNATDVALRRDPGGSVVVRMPKDTCVWISDSKMDGKGKLWLKVNTGLNISHANYDCYGWMMADFLDYGDALWHDVAEVSCSPFGNGAMIRFDDGMAVTASRPVVSEDSRAWVPSRRMLEQHAPVRQVLTSAGLNFFSLDANGAMNHCWSPLESAAGERFRLIGGADGFVVGVTEDGRLAGGGKYDSLYIQWVRPAETPSPEVLARVEQISFFFDWILLRTDAGELLVACYHDEARLGDHPDWAAWQGVRSIDAGIYCCEDQATTKGFVFAAVRQDGSALIYPEALRKNADWQGLADVRVGQHFLLALRRDGTAFAVSTDGRPAPDVSGWREVVAIAASRTYCIGVRRDGTLVFAGDVTFMEEGHVKK